MSKTSIKVSRDSYECTITVDCNIFGFQDNQLKILMIKRAVEPFIGEWLLPGGMMTEGQTLDMAVENVLFELTGIREVHQRQIKCYSEVERHPLKRVVTVSFYALIKPENHPYAPKNYASEVSWHPINNLPLNIGVDHPKLIADALVMLRKNLRDELIFGELLAEKFTLKELQDLYESVLDEKLDRRNFRKKILQMDLLVNTGEKKVGVKGGPDLFKVK